MQKHTFGDILALTSLFFAPIILILNLLCAFIVDFESLLKLGAVLIIFLLILFTCAIIIISKDKRIKLIENKGKFHIISTVTYTFISLVINIIAWCLQSESSGKLWNLYTILTILGFSIAFSLLIIKSKGKGFRFKAIMYFLVTAIPYFLIMVVITDFFTGAKLFIPIGIYAFIYGSITVFFGVKANKNRIKELNEKPYEKQF